MFPLPSSLEGSLLYLKTCHLVMMATFLRLDTNVYSKSPQYIGTWI